MIWAKGICFLKQYFSSKVPNYTPTCEQYMYFEGIVGRSKANICPQSQDNNKANPQVNLMKHFCPSSRDAGSRSMNAC